MSKVKDKGRTLKAATEKLRVTYKGAPRRLSADFSKETLQARSWQEVFQVMEDKDPVSYTHLTLPTKIV